ncbi:virion morphogenesis protein [Desulfoluna spongiiphila]|uniref:virion morphogenesis protein n=1 Tax=Desulfoluna spongiiphila TaxID=419481 RepID=UPI001254ED97|nr:virion morphogenesis protein [Desulfoluna spongiiphila]VVS90778.1 consensus disorder prediction [Desulfoluna spongiiphila]
MNLAVKQDQRKTLQLLDQLDVLSMSTAQSRRLLADIGMQTRKKTRDNVRGQKTVSGARMDPRADGRTKRKMMRKMAKGMQTKVVSKSKATVGWKNVGQARVADRHHRGVAESWTPRKMAKVHGVPDYKKPATAAQARALNREGFRRRVARKRGKGGAVLKRVPAKWIMDNMTLGQAGLILRLIRYKTRIGKQAWDTKPAPRPILGATPEDADAFLTQMTEDALKRVRRA